MRKREKKYIDDKEDATITLTGFTRYAPSQKSTFSF